MHCFPHNCRNDRLISDSLGTRLRLQHVHYVSACTGIDDLHDDPEEVRIDESDMLADNVSVTRRIHNGAFSSQFLHRTVFKLRAVDYLNRDSLTCVGSFQALRTPNDTEVSHSDDDFESVAGWPRRPVLIRHYAIASVLCCQLGSVGLHHSL